MFGHACRGALGSLLVAVAVVSVGCAGGSDGSEERLRAALRQQATTAEARETATATTDDTGTRSSDGSPSAADGGDAAPHPDVDAGAHGEREDAPGSNDGEATGADACSAGDLVAAVPATLELAGALGRLVDPQVHETEFVHRAATDLVVVGSRVRGAARRADACSPSAREARRLLSEAGARAVRAGLALQRASDPLVQRSPEAARRMVERYEPELKALSDLLRTATRLVNEAGEHS